MGVCVCGAVAYPWRVPGKKKGVAWCVPTYIFEPRSARPASLTLPSVLTPPRLAAALETAAQSGSTQC